MLNTFQDDPCCAKGLAKALRDGKLDAVNVWTCPKCGCEWRPTGYQTDDTLIRHWEPHELVALLRV